MSKEALGRALMTVGGGLENMAKITYQNERDQANFMREQSLLRLRGQQEKDIQGEGIAARERIANKELEGHKALMEADWQQRGKERELDREMRLDIADKTVDYQTRRIDEQQRKSIDAAGQARLKTLDTQMSEYRQMLDEAELESVAGVNEEAKARIQQTIDQLAMQRRQVSFENIAHLKALGDPRYVEMDDAALLRAAGYTPAEVEAILDDAKNGGAAPAEGTPAEPAAPSAPAPASPSQPQLMPDTPPQSQDQDLFGMPLNISGKYYPEFGQGGRQLMDLIRNKPWIRSPIARERMGLPPKDDTLAGT